MRQLAIRASLLDLEKNLSTTLGPKPPYLLLMVDHERDRAVCCLDLTGFKTSREARKGITGPLWKWKLAFDAWCGLHQEGRKRRHRPFYTYLGILRRLGMKPKELHATFVSFLRYLLNDSRAKGDDIESQVARIKGVLDDVGLTKGWEKGSDEVARDVCLGRIQPQEVFNIWEIEQRAREAAGRKRSRKRSPGQM